MFFSNSKINPNHSQTQQSPLQGARALALALDGSKFFHHEQATTASPVFQNPNFGDWILKITFFCCFGYNVFGVEDCEIGGGVGAEVGGEEGLQILFEEETGSIYFGGYWPWSAWCSA